MSKWITTSPTVNFPMSEATIHHINSLDKSPAPKVGLVLTNANDGLVLAYHLRNVAGDGLYASWTVLCHLPNDTYSPFVVWTLIARPEGWYCENGDYYGQISNAVRGYEGRAGIAEAE